MLQPGHHIYPMRDGKPPTEMESYARVKKNHEQSELFARVEELEQRVARLEKANTTITIDPATGRAVVKDGTGHIIGEQG
jgi:hypothetical protein